jgi:hypothetical protein
LVPGCTTTNATNKSSSSFAYSFPFTGVTYYAFCHDYSCSELSIEPSRKNLCCFSTKTIPNSVTVLIMSSIFFYSPDAKRQTAIIIFFAQFCILQVQMNFTVLRYSFRHPYSPWRTALQPLDGWRMKRAPDRKWMAIHSTMVSQNIIYFNGFFHLTPGKREKSVSVEINSQPCSLARAAKCASVTRLATAWPSINIF